MTLDTSRWIVRYYFFLVRLFGDEDSVDWRMRKGTSLCLFFWRIVICTTVLALLVIVGSLFLVLVVSHSISDPWSLLTILGMFVGLIAVSALATFGVIGIGRAAKSDNIVVTYIKAAKRGICPLINFNRPDAR